MRTPGQALVEDYPDEFDASAVDEIDQSIKSGLTDPARRGETIKKLRDRFEFGAAPDDAVMMSVFQRLDARQKPAVDPSSARETQEGLRMKRVGQGYGASLQQLGEMKGGEGPLASPPEAVQKAEEAVRGTLTPQDVEHPRVQGDARRGIPAMAERIEDLQDAAAKNPGLKIVQANTDWWSKWFPNVQLQDDVGNTVSQLNPAAGFDASQVEGMPTLNLGQITGAGSSLQQGLTETARDVYDPKTGKWFRGMDPKTANMGKDGTGNPLSRAQGYGFREYGMDLAGRTPDSDVAQAAWKLANIPAAAGGAVLAGVDKLEANAGRSLDALTRWPQQGEGRFWQKFAESNDAEAKKYWDASGQLMENTGWVGDKRNAVPDTKEAQAEAQRGLGATMGEALSMKVPTGGDLAVKAVAPLVSKGVGSAARGVGKLAEKAAPDAYAGVVGLFSSAPMTTALSRGEANIIKGAQAAGRNAGDIAEMKFTNELRDAIAKALPGRTDDQVEAAIREAQMGWHSVPARQAMSADAKLVVEAAQPFHERTFRSMFGEKFPYSPTHVFRGQRANKSARLLETARAQDAVADTALQAEELAKDVGKKYDPMPGWNAPGFAQVKGPAQWREARGWADTQKMLADQGKAEGFFRGLEKRRGAEEMDRLDLVSGMAKTFRQGAESRGIRERAAVKVFEDHVADLAKGPYKDSYVPAQVRFGKSADELFSHQPVPMAGGAVAHNAGDRITELNAYRDAIKGGRNLLAPDVSDALRQNDEVLVVGVKAADDAGGLLKAVDPKQQRVVVIPGLSRDWHGVVMPRQHALALLQAQSPSAASRTAAKVASTVDQWLGLSQLNYAITKGNPGFEARNRVSEMWRMAVDDEDILGEANRDLVQKVLSSRPGEGQYGKLHEEILSLGGLGKGVIEDMRGMQGANPGPMWMSERLKTAINAPVKLAEAGQDALVNGTLKRTMFPRVPQQYSVEDAFRTAVMLNEMKKGAKAVDAAAHMKRLMIDYADYNPVERLAKPFVPFIKYYTGAAEGAVALAMKNPRRFARVYDLARIVERWDTEFEGGGRPLNQKLKGTDDVIGGAPIIQEGGSITAIRPETTASEAASQIALWQSGLGGLMGEDQERGLGANLSPAVTQAIDTLTGMSAATGRSTSGLSKAEMDLARYEGAHTGPEQALAAYRMREQGLAPSTENNRLALAKDLLRYIPIASRVGDAPYLRFLSNMALGQTNPASRSEESQDAYATRSLRGQITGLRSSTLTPSAEALKQQKRRGTGKSRTDVQRQNQRQQRTP